VELQPPAAAVSLSERCVREVAQPRRKACQSEPCCLGSPAQALPLPQPLAGPFVGYRLGWLGRTWEQVPRPNAGPLMEYPVESRAPATSWTMSATTMNPTPSAAASRR
jgi:hypothetical protein